MRTRGSGDRLPRSARARRATPQAPPSVSARSSQNTGPPEQSWANEWPVQPSCKDSGSTMPEPSCFPAGGH
eukprot:10231756-Alexandrium_andersonii.AAC.1